MFDFFVAPLRCPGCGAEAPAAEIQTYLRRPATDGTALRVGFEFDAADLSTENIVGAGYALIEPPAPGRPIRLLDVWMCSSCETEPWAMVEIVDRRIRGISAVTLDRAALSSSHFISDTNADILADSLRGDLQGIGSVEVLRRRLPG